MGYNGGMDKKFIREVGEKLRRIDVGVIMALIIAFLSISPIDAALGISPKSLMDVVWLIVRLILVAVGVVIVIQGIGYLFTWLGKEKETNIKVDLIPKVEDESPLMGGVIRKIAYLEVHNNEDVEITDCRVTLVKVEYYREPYFYPMEIKPYKDKRIKWAENYYPDKDCMLTIPREGRVEAQIFRTFPPERRDEKGSWGIGFMLCESKSDFDNLGVYIVKIRVDGKFRGVEIKPIYFDGYLYFNQIEATQILYFKQGNWEENDNIPIPRPPKDENEEHE